MTDVVVIGAGQAGLSTAWGLSRTGLDFVVLDGEAGPGGAWRHRWTSLRLSDAHRVSPLPGLDLAPADASRPANEVVPEYFADYERRFALPVVRPVRVAAVRSVGELLAVETDRGTWTTRALVNATGTWTRPFVPYYPGAETFRGRQLHTVDFPGAAAFAGQRVVVVGGGTSAVQFLLQIAPVAARTTWVTRTPPRWREAPFDVEAGREAVALVEERVRRGLPPRPVVSVTGLPLTDVNRAGIAAGVLDRRPMFTAVTPTGVRWGEVEEPADVLLWATGFRPAIGHLAPLHLRSPRGGITLDGTRAVADPRVHLVGYGPSASTIGANRAGRAAAHELAAYLGTPVSG